MSKCKLCNKSYSYNKYKSFGRGCLNKMYKITDIEIPKNVKDRESFLISKIAKRLRKTGLNKEQKRELSELYLATCYIDRIDYADMSKVKEKIEEMLDTASIIMPNRDLTMMLYAMYKLYKASDNFKSNLKEIENMNIENFEYSEGKLKEEQKNKNIINSFKYIFDISKISNPALYTLNYYRQYIFWETVVIGGWFMKYKLASKLLQHSLSILGEEPEDYVITDEDTINDITKDIDFNNKIREFIKSSNGDEKIEGKGNLLFENNTDLKYSLQNVYIKINAYKKTEDTWNVTGEISDIFDFTDFKFPEEFESRINEIRNNPELSEEEKLKSIEKNSFGNILNNLAIISSEYGLIKTFDVKMNFKIENYK